MSSKDTEFATNAERIDTFRSLINQLMDGTMVLLTPPGDWDKVLGLDPEGFEALQVLSAEAGLTEGLEWLANNLGVQVTDFMTMIQDGYEAMCGLYEYQPWHLEPWQQWSGEGMPPWRWVATDPETGNETIIYRSKADYYAS